MLSWDFAITVERILSIILSKCLEIFSWLIFFLLVSLAEGTFKRCIQKYATYWVFLAFLNRKFVFLYSPIWLMGMSFLISLNNPLFKNIQHVGSFWYFIICCICVFVFLYLHVWFMEISFLISLNNPLFKNIQHVGAFWYFVICCICVFVYLYFCICMFD